MSITACKAGNSGADDFLVCLGDSGGCGLVWGAIDLESNRSQATFLLARLPQSQLVLKLTRSIH
jgi:hypothetical protein